MEKNYRYLGFELIFTGFVFGFFFLFGMMGARADSFLSYETSGFTGNFDFAPSGQISKKESLTRYTSRDAGYISELQLSFRYLYTTSRYRINLYTDNSGDADVNFFQSEWYAATTAGTSCNYKIFDFSGVSTPLMSVGSVFWIGIESEFGLHNNAYPTFTTCVSNSRIDGDGSKVCVPGDSDNCSNTTFRSYPMMKVYMQGNAPFLSDLSLFSPVLPYVSSSTPIKFTILSPDAAKVICVNNNNSWRQESAVGGSNSYHSFSADVDSGANGIRCHSEIYDRRSEYLDFDLTLELGSLEYPTPIFVEVAPGHVYNYNPARVQVKGLKEGDIWCKRGVSAFFNAGSIQDNGSVYFDLDFEDIGTLENGLEYTVLCYLETTEGNSETVQQVHTYKAKSICSPDFGTSPGDKGLIIKALGTAYKFASELPLIGDLIYLDCVILQDFYSNLVLVETSNLTYHINAFNVDQDVVIPLVTLKSTMESWLTGTGYSSIKSTITTLLWILLMFGLFFKFLFPMIWTSTHQDNSGGTNSTFREIEDKLEEDMFK